MTTPKVSPAASRIAFTLWLDVLLLVLFLLSEAPRITGVAAHEVIGIAIAIPIVLHVLLSWHWIATKTRRVFAGGSWRTRINYLINAGTFIVMVIVIATGVVVSRVVLPAAGIATIYDRDWFAVHDASSNVVFIAIGLHLAMNWGWAMAAIRRRGFTLEEEAAIED